METLVLIFVVLCVIGLMIYALEHLPIPGAAAFKPWLIAIVAVVGALYLVQRFLV
jgi:hypothetical protein